MEFFTVRSLWWGLLQSLTRIPCRKGRVTTDVRKGRAVDRWRAALRGQRRPLQSLFVASVGHGALAYPCPLVVTHADLPRRARVPGPRPVGAGAPQVRGARATPATAQRVVGHPLWRHALRRAAVELAGALEAREPRGGRGEACLVVQRDL